MADGIQGENVLSKDVVYIVRHPPFLLLQKLCIYFCFGNAITSFFPAELLTRMYTISFFMKTFPPEKLKSIDFTLFPS